MICAYKQAPSPISNFPLGRIPLVFVVGGSGNVDQVKLYSITDFNRVIEK